MWLLLHWKRNKFNGGSASNSARISWPDETNFGGVLNDPIKRLQLSGRGRNRLTSEASTGIWTAMFPVPQRSQ